MITPFSTKNRFEKIKKQKETDKVQKITIWLWSSLPFIILVNSYLFTIQNKKVCSFSKKSNYSFISSGMCLERRSAQLYAITRTDSDWAYLVSCLSLQSEELRNTFHFSALLIHRWSSSIDQNNLNQAVKTFSTCDLLLPSASLKFVLHNAIFKSKLQKL